MFWSKLSNVKRVSPNHSRSSRHNTFKRASVRCFTLAEYFCDWFVYERTINMEEPSKSSSKTKSSSSSSSSKSKKDGKEKEEYSSEFLRGKLREFFNHPDFKSTLQKESIKEIMRGTKCKGIHSYYDYHFMGMSMSTGNRDVFVSMPTGSGKVLVNENIFLEDSI